MKINSITVEKLNYLLKEFETNIEIKNVDGKLFLRNKYWEKIKDVKIYWFKKLVPLELIRQQKKKKNYFPIHDLQQNNYCPFNFENIFTQPLEINQYFQHLMNLQLFQMNIPEEMSNCQSTLNINR